MKRPEGVVVEPVRARVIRGPHPDGSGRWYWRAELYDAGNGTGRTVWTGWAIRAEVGALLVAQIAEHGLNKPEPEPDAIRTVQDLLEAWLGQREGAADLSPMTKRSSRGSAARLVGSAGARTALGAVLVAHLDKRHLEAYRDTATGGESTITRDLKTLRSAWRWGRDLGVVPDRGLPTLTRTGKAKPAKPVYTRFTPSEAEVAAVIGAVRRPWVRRAVLLLYATGGRIGEVASLRWGAIAPYWRDLPTSRGEPLCDASGLALSWRATSSAALVLDGKTGPREVPLHPSVAAEVESWRTADLDPSALVLGVSRATATTRVQLELADAAERLGLPRLSPNGLRRAAERALYRTREVDVAASIMGHSPETALKHYREVTGEERARVVRAAGLAVPSLEPTASVIAFPAGREP